MRSRAEGKDTKRAGTAGRQQSVPIVVLCSGTTIDPRERIAVWR